MRRPVSSSAGGRRRRSTLAVAPLLLLPPLLLPVLLAGCGGGPPPEVVATSTLGAVSRAELESYIVSLPEEMRRPADDADLVEWRAGIAERMLVERALEAEAEEADLVSTPQGQELLAARIDPLLAEAVRERRLAEAVDVSEEDVRAYYDAHREELGHGEQIRLRHIFRRTERDASPEERAAVRAEMEELHRQLRAGANFQELAKAWSESETAHTGGLIGRLNRGDLDPSLEELVWGLEEGEFSDVVATPVGFHIFRLDDHLDAFQLPFDEARNRLRRRLVREATEEAREETFAELLAASGATWNPDGLFRDDPSVVLFALGDDVVRLADWRARLASAPFHLQREPSQPEQLRQLAENRLLLWEAERLGLADEPEVAARIARERRQVGIELAYQRYRRQIIDAIPEEEVRALYEAQKARLQTPQLFRLSLLVRDFPPESESERWYEVYEELAGLAEEIRAGRRDLAAAAREISDDLSAPDGGDVGLVRMDAFARWAGPQAQKEVMALAEGELSDPILVERYNPANLNYDRVGYMLVRVEEILEPRQRSFEEARGQVVERHVEEGSAELDARIREAILASIEAKVHEQHL